MLLCRYFPPGLSWDSDNVCLMIISAELIPNRLNHALQINASLVDLVDKDNGGNVHFPQGMEQNTVWACTPSLAEITKMAPSKQPKSGTPPPKIMWPGVSTMLTLHLCHWKDCRLNGNPTLPLQKHGVRPRCPFFDAPRF